MLQQRKHILMIHKVRAHSNIKGIKNSKKLAKSGSENEHRLPSFLHEDAHSTPYYLHTDFWLDSMSRTPYIGPIGHLQKYLIKHYNMFFLKYLEEKFPNISKWTNGPYVDNKLSNTFWKNPQIREAQIKQL